VFVRFWPLLLLSCAPPLLEAERNYCLSSLECERDERCIQQACVARAVDAGPADAGASCEDPDRDGAHLDGLILQRADHQHGRHVCPLTPDRYRHNLSAGAQVFAWAVSASGPAPKLQLVDRNSALPSSCDGVEEYCAQGGQLTGLVASRRSSDFDLGVVASEDAMTRYELGFRVGSTCTQRNDCGNGGRCVRPLAESPGAVAVEGICAFAQDGAVAPSCDRNDNSSEHPEAAIDAGEFADFSVRFRPLCQNDNDWYSVLVSDAATILHQVEIRATDAADDELEPLFLFAGLYSEQNQPIAFAVLRFATASSSESLRFANIAAGRYRLRITQINRRAGPITYSIIP
jgi:hypothetical protein